MERRRYPRFELKVSAKFKAADKKHAFEAGHTKNISAEGLCFESDKKLDAGTYVDIEMDLQDNKGLVGVTGEVRWSEQVTDPSTRKKKYINGIKLLNISGSDEGRFLKYYCDKMVEKLSNYLKM